MHGVSGQALAFGPGWLPVGDHPSSASSTVLAGHRDSHFAFLQNLLPGQEIVLQQQQLPEQRYVVTATQVVDSRSQPLEVWPGQRLLLVTCFPFDAIDPHGPLRYLVYAEPVAAAANSSIPKMLATTKSLAM
jgi:sortase A